MFRIILLILVLLSMTVGLSLWWFAQDSLPAEDGIVSVPSLLSEVEVIKDDRGVPFIKAGSEADLYRAQGYWTASGRLFQMDMLRRIARGELSEVFGSPCLPQDKLMRQIGFARVADEEYKLLSPAVKKSLEAYCAGVNDFIDGKDAKKPLECWFFFYTPSKWRPQDTLAVMKYIQYLAHESWSLDDLRQRVIDKTSTEIASQLFEQPLYKEGGTTGGGSKPAGEPPPQNGENGSKKASPSPSAILPGTGAGAGFPPLLKVLGRSLVSHPGFGSNGWAISGSLTDSGGSILALDRHSQFGEPNLFQALSLSCPQLNVAGVTVPGVPGIMFGRNQSIAWGGVELKIDCQDLFVEQFSPQFHSKYRTPDGWAVSTEIFEDIVCRGWFGNEIPRHKVVVTRHGPVLLQSGDNAVVLAWSGLDISKPQLETYFKLNRAGNWQEFRDALKDYKGGAQVFFFADKDGKVGSQVAGNIPVRKISSLTGKFSGSQLLPGFTGECDWLDRLPFAEMPVSYGDQVASGYLVANSISLPSVRQNSSPYAARRIDDFLRSATASSRRPGLPDMAVLQGDEYAPLYRLVKETLRANVDKQEVVDKFQLSTLKLFEQWDGYLRRRSASALIYEAFLRTVARRALVPRIGDELTREYMTRWPRWSVLVEKILTDKSTDWLPPEERTFETFVVTSLSQALADVRLALNSDEPSAWEWQKAHQAKFEHIMFSGVLELKKPLAGLINLKPVGVGGDGDTVNATSIARFTRPGYFDSDLGPTARLLIDMSDQDKFYETQPLGQSGHLLSTNRGDQMKAWRDQQPLPVALSLGQAERQQRHKLRFSPAETQE
ncbi:MAG: penicillin acylase family protein [Candidatus Obscuribacterales bacterium]